MSIAWYISIVMHTQGPLAQWLEQTTHNRLVVVQVQQGPPKSLFTYQEELRYKGDSMAVNISRLTPF